MNGKRYRCSACGNQTHFEVITRQRESAYFHFTIGGELTKEDVRTDTEIEKVTCLVCDNTKVVEVSAEPATTE